MPKDAGFAVAHETLLDIVTLALDSEDQLIPKTAVASKRRQSLRSGQNVTLNSASSQATLRERSTSQSDLAPSYSGAPSVNEQQDDGVTHTADADDFTIMTEEQAKRITTMIEVTFGVELSTDVVIADANVATLTRRVLGARSLLQSPDSKVG